MKKRILSLLLAIAVVFSAAPLFTVQADAFSTGAKTLVKTRTVTIKPGKTYKTPVFKLKKKMALQVPIKIRLAKKNLTDSDYNYTLSYNLTLKTSKGKTKDTFKVKNQGMYDPYTDDMEYVEWVYFNYKNSIKKPCYAKGKYYFTIKNTSKKAIKVTYSVKGYTKFATDASLSKSLTADCYDIRVKAGRVGPGIPLLKSVKSSNKEVGISWFMTHNGTLYLYPDATHMEDSDTVVTVTLKTGKQYKIKLHVTGDPEFMNAAEEEDL